NGPPLVLAAQMRGLTPDVFRATLAFTFTLSGSLSLLMYVAARLVTREALLLALAAVPLIVVGQRIGIRLQPRLSGRRFERLVYGLLLLSGTSIGVSGVLG
ncbi:MAG: TSUP family transporter, partial [Actinomycetota bacterium]